MSIVYRIVIVCDRCDAEKELHSDWRLPAKARWEHIAPPRGWKAGALEHDTEYGHVCSECRKEIADGKDT